MEIVPSAVGAAAIRRFTVKGSDGELVPAATALALPLDRFYDQALATASTFVRYGGPTAFGGSRWDPVPDADQTQMSSAYTKRRERSKAAAAPWEVARICLAARRSGANEAQAVIDDLGKSKTQAYRLISDARAAGFLD